MRGVVVLIALLGVSACEREEDRSAVPSPGTMEAVVPAQASKPPPVVPRPEDQAQLDRMILAGYTPHGNHLHSPGVNECPLTKGSEAVM